MKKKKSFLNVLQDLHICKRNLTKISSNIIENTTESSLFHLNKNDILKIYFILFFHKQLVNQHGFFGMYIYESYKYVG